MENSLKPQESALAPEDWDLLVRRIKGKRCTPFVGAGASCPTLRLGSEIADQWAKLFDYPLADSSDLAKVAQYLAIEKDPFFPKEEIQREFINKPPPNFEECDQPHCCLADLNLPIYITTNYDDFMFQALEYREKKPKRELCHWNESVKHLAPTVLGGEYEPSPANPLVFHLHGHYKWPQSLVLTEDDYLEFLVNFSNERRLQFLPPAIRNALAHTSLLFVGYSLADWSFRVLFRSVIEALGSTSGMKSIAVQLEPPAKNKSKTGIERAQVYLEKYFSRIQQKIEVRVYWGEARAFAGELRAHLEA